MNFLIRLMCLACLLAMVNLSLHATVHIDHALGDSAALVDCQCCQTYDSLADHGALNFKPLATARVPYPDFAVNNLARHRHHLFYARAPLSNRSSSHSLLYRLFSKFKGSFK